MADKLVKGMDEQIWRKFTGYCKMENKKVGVLLNQILKEYLKGKIR